jgi:hypothetical protein
MNEPPDARNKSWSNQSRHDPYLTEHDIGARRGAIQLVLIREGEAGLSEFRPVDFGPA